MAARSSHILRVDARDNRDRIVDSARALFAADGFDVPVREIARHAGVGPATVYRRFPTKQALATAAFAEQVRACRAVLDDGLADPDPWRGFHRTLERTFELHARSGGFAEAFTAAFPGAADVAVERRYSLHATAELARRAMRTGQLRADFVLDDLVLALSAHRSLQAASSTSRIAASRRFAALVIRGLMG